MIMQIFGIRFYLAEIISSFGTVCLKPVAEMIQDDRDLLGPLWLSSPPVFERPQWADSGRSGWNSIICHQSRFSGRKLILCSAQGPWLSMARRWAGVP